jgi:DNA-binding XRE family transcriptional regulator
VNRTIRVAPAAVAPPATRTTARGGAPRRAVSTRVDAGGSAGARDAGDLPTDPRARFAANLRRHRRSAGLSQEALAAAARLHRTEISLLERSERDPRLTTVVRLARALHVRPADLVDGID